jgi:hypothetical protein
MKITGNIVLVIAAIVLVSAADCGTVDIPNWVNNMPSPGDGLIYYVGYSRAMSSSLFTIARAGLYARNKLIDMLQKNEISRIHPIPDNAKNRTTFSSSYNGQKIEGVISDEMRIDMWIDEDGGIYVLYACTGIEIKE